MNKPTVNFTRMRDGSREDYLMLRELEVLHLAIPRLSASCVKSGGCRRAVDAAGLQDHLLSSTCSRVRSVCAATALRILIWIVAVLLHDIGHGLV